MSLKLVILGNNLFKKYIVIGFDDFILFNNERKISFSLEFEKSISIFNFDNKCLSYAIINGKFN